MTAINYPPHGTLNVWDTVVLSDGTTIGGEAPTIDQSEAAGLMRDELVNTWLAQRAGRFPGNGVGRLPSNWTEAGAPSVPTMFNRT